MLGKQRLMLFALLLSSLVSCASAPPDGPVCTRINMVEGWCINTITDVEETVKDEPLGADGKRLKDKHGKPVPWSDYLQAPDGRRLGWSDIEEESVYVPGFYWAKIKAYMLKTCKQLKTCQQGVGNWQAKADKIDQKVKK